MNLNELTHLEAILCRNSFREFIELAWPYVSSDPFVDGYHVSVIAEHLQAVAEQRISKLFLNVAIRHSKSLLVSVLFPVWMQVRDPSTRIITATYSKDLTVRDAIRSRHLIESQWFAARFPNLLVLTEDQSRKDYYTNTAKGHRLSASIGARTVGFDADLIVCDDLLNLATCGSKAERDTACDYYETSLESRLVYSGREAIILAGHRTHEDDIFARIRAKYGDDGSWTYCVLPEEYTPKFSTYFSAIGWQDRRVEGELLWPDRFSYPVLQQEKKRYRHNYSTIFQQEPIPQAGNLFKPENFRSYTETATHYVLGQRQYPIAELTKFITIDTASSTTAEADWTVAQCWAVAGSSLVLVGQLRKKLDGAKIVPELKAFCDQHRPEFVSIETEFIGAFVIDQLRALNVPVKKFSAKKHGSKEIRSVAAQVRFESEQIWFPADRPWVTDIQSELLAFPNGAHDDQVDCISMAATLLNKLGEEEPEELTPEQQTERQRQAEADRYNRILHAGGKFGDGGASVIRRI